MGTTSQGEKKGLPTSAGSAGTCGQEFLMPMHLLLFLPYACEAILTESSSLMYQGVLMHYRNYVRTALVLDLHKTR